METTPPVVIPQRYHMPGDHTPLVLNLGLSPFIYENTSDQLEVVRFSGGVGLLVSISRDGVNFYTYLATLGEVILGPVDKIQIAFTLAPTMTVYRL